MSSKIDEILAVLKDGPKTRETIIRAIRAMYKQRNEDPPTPKNISQTIYNAVYSKKIVSSVTSAGKLKVYSLVLATPAINPPTFKASVPQAPASAGIDLSGAVEAIALAVSGTLATILKDRLALVVQQQLQSALATLPTQIAEAMQPVAEPPKKEPEKVTKLRITIAGLLPGQEAMITKEFGKEIDLHFVSNQSNSSIRLKSLARSSTAVITMTGFISHATEDIITSVGGNLIRVSGGMTSLRTELTRIYIGG